ncbi:hypothetical protein B0H16DRAFT_1784310 [Mycena metata]|uniref:DUF6535 domain-containing protein n=1 Tax=Mycena metata TaxID=1033252 RepID=A0AAD7P254_9AGAR|nr:hypothetical protein B0H16DRAFT_1784310 [Mycena metata]
MPQVPASSSSAWNPLLRSTLSSIEPTVARWRGGMDTLLIFVGLFSAIVTAFYVDSTSGLQPDNSARTNELLANLTDIVIAISKVEPSSLNIAPPVPFHPDPGTLRLNVYWSLSLVLSVSLAALAVMFRGFLERLTRSEHLHATKKLTDVCARWEEAQRVLAPMVESLPQLMVIPVALFILGLLDSLVSSASAQTSPSIPILIAGGLSSMFIAAVALVLLYVVLDGVTRPYTSPFQTAITRAIARLRSTVDFGEPQDSTPETILTALERETYCKVVQVTHDDDSLDQAAAAARSLFEQGRAMRSPTEWWEQEIKTVLHLLSPEASMSSNLTAAQLFLHADTSRERTQSTYALARQFRGPLSAALIAAAERYAIRFHKFSALWHSHFTVALATINDLGSFFSREVPVLGLFLSEDAATPFPFSSTDASQRQNRLVRYGMQLLNSKMKYEIARYDNLQYSGEELENKAMDGLFSGPVKDRFAAGNDALYRILSSMLLLQTPIPWTWSRTCLAFIRWMWRMEPEVFIRETEHLIEILDARILNHLVAQRTLEFLTDGMAQITYMVGRGGQKGHITILLRANARLLRLITEQKFGTLSNLDRQVTDLIRLADGHLSRSDADTVRDFMAAFKWYEAQTNDEGNVKRERLLEDFRELVNKLSE